MESDKTTTRSFILYPTNRVVGTIADADDAQTAVNALIDAGFEAADIDVLHGDDAAHRLDPTGAKHGFLAQFQRTVLRTLASVEEYTHLTHHVEDVRAGRFVVMVLAKPRERRLVAANTLKTNGATSIGFYGRWAWEGYAPAGEETSDASGSAGHVDGFAQQPEQLPSLFAAAWNERDPDAIASLFEEDAEFVNVTGMWWRRRDSIRKAHTHGLERIFNQSTLTVDEVGIKLLSESIAVVHARMTLSGQTPVGAVKQPGARTNIFSFVLRRNGDRWLCASAHNTDVIPRMETNVVSEDGALRAANYRTGQVS
jgi:uncharacterized protein (TIGR02246 family)